MFGTESGAVPEVWQIIKGQTVAQRLNRDYTLTIDRDLQQTVVDQLKGNHGAVVVFNPQPAAVWRATTNPPTSLKGGLAKGGWTGWTTDGKTSRSCIRRSKNTLWPGSRSKTWLRY